MASERTKSLRTKKNIFFALSLITWVSVSIFSAISAFALYNAKDEKGMPIFSDDLKAFLASMGIVVILAIIAAIVIKDKLRTACWMLCLIICSICFKTVGMYSILAAWFIDEYIFANLYKYYKNKLVINKEIDLRLESR